MKEYYENTKSWPFEEARKLLKKVQNKTPEKGYVLFETGYGPSGLPHIGTFGEVVRTCFVKFAFEKITNGEIPAKLLCISDDMDALRKVPQNIPNQEIIKNYIGMPLTAIPDPFNTYSSYGHHMNARLQSFLDSFHFKYEFLSATESYKKGKFNQMLLKVVEKYEDLMSVMLPTLRQERKETYSPLMPICPKTGKVLAEGVKSIDKQKGTVIFLDSEGIETELPVTDGNCKLQWKIDFGARWAALDVDYEIFGKEHGPNAPIYQKICKILGGRGPVNFIYELFLGEDGDKISKSKGNGISVEEWLSYAPSESLKLFMFQTPTRAKKLYFDTIPKAVDEYISHIKSYHSQEQKLQLENPAFFIHEASVPEFDLRGIDYTLLLHLASAASPENEDVLWGFINTYNPDIKKGDSHFVDKIVKCAISYFEKFVKPGKIYRKPDIKEREGLLKLLSFLESEKAYALNSKDMQTKVYEIGKELNFDLKNWFSTIYEVVLGQKEGPRVGTFICVYGIQNTIELLKFRLN